LGGFVRDADREDREVVEEEGVEVIVGVDDQHVRFRGMEMLCDLGIEPRSRAIRALLGHQRRKIRRVGHANGGDDLGHLVCRSAATGVQSAQSRRRDKQPGIAGEAAWTPC
jgi:hypothetical protein